MWQEVIMGALVGFATYMYLHYLNRKKEREHIDQLEQRKAARNATETETEIETINWLNFLIKHWYLSVDEKLAKNIKQSLQPTLDELTLPAPITGITLESVSFGQSPPFIQSCRAEREVWEDMDLQTLELTMGPRIESPEFNVTLNINGIGKVTMSDFSFDGKLQVNVLIDQKLSFPCIKHVYVTFAERPDMKFKLSLGSVDAGSFPGIQSFLENMIEEAISDTLVDPGRFLIDMSKPDLDVMLIMGVRKLKRTVLHIQVSIMRNKAGDMSDKKKLLKLYLNTGGKNLSSEVTFYKTPQYHHIWFPLAVLQEEISFSIYNQRTLAQDEKLSEMILDVNTLLKDRTKELSRLSIHQHNMLIIIKATAYELPYIPIRQSGSKVTDYSPYFKIPILSKADINMCSSGLVYLHIHRAVGLPAMDTTSKTSDPYVKVKVNGEKLFKTQVVSKNCNPVFNHFDDFFVRNIIETDLVLIVMDHDKTSSNDEIGTVRVNLKDVAPKMVDQGFEIHTHDKKQAGTLFISVIFRPVSLPPIKADVTNCLHDNIGAVTIL